MARLIGVILGEQSTDDGGKERNDRLVAVAEKSHLYGHITHIDGLERFFLKELEEFFVAASRMADKHVTIEGWDGGKAAKRAIKQAAEQYIRRGAA